MVEDAIRVRRVLTRSAVAHPAPFCPDTPVDSCPLFSIHYTYDAPRLRIRDIARYGNAGHNGASSGAGHKPRDTGCPQTLEASS